MMNHTIKKQALFISIYICILLANYCRSISSLAIDRQADLQSTYQNHQASPESGHEQTKKTIQRQDFRRPLWNLAHMVNSIKELDYRLGKGANAIEADVTFNQLGVPIYTYHGPPCDCWRHCHQQEDFNDYLSYVHQIAIAEPYGIGKNMTLLFLDLKLDYLDQISKARAGIELAISIMNHLYPKTQDQVTDWLRYQDNSSSRLRLILSVNHVTDVELINNFIHHLDRNNATHLMNNIGFDVGMNDDIQQIETMWRRFDNSLNIWQGDGFTNCFSPFYNLERLSKAIMKRDNESGFPKKVYQWTIDIHDRIREALRMGVDAIMTNHPERLLTILKEPEIAHTFRLATRDDDPFKKIITRVNARNSETARYQRSVNSSGGGFLGSLIDVISSWIAYVREIPFLSLPTTSRFMPKMSRSIFRRSTTTTSTVTPPPKIGLARSDNLTTFDEARDIYGVTENNSTVVLVPSSTELSTTPAALSMTEANENGNTTTTTLISNSTMANDNQQLVIYEGPKWYVSLASNFLISMLKLVLPVNSTISTATPSSTTTSST